MSVRIRQRHRHEAGEASNSSQGKVYPMPMGQVSNPCIEQNVVGSIDRQHEVRAQVVAPRMIG